MLLAIDIGNTNITIGIFQQGRGCYIKGPVKIWRLSTDKNRTAEEYGISLLDLFHYSGIDPEKISGVAAGSVVPSLDGIFADIATTYFHKKIFFVTGATATMLKMRFPNPGEVGADRLCDAVAANAFFGCPSIVIDFGTATTFDCIDATGAYRGGAIAPGPGISAESLAARTAKLPRVDMVKPAKAIGTSTVESIQSGLYFGYVGLVKEILKRLTAELGGTPAVIATGGLAGLIVPEIKEVKKIVPELTLEGIRLIFEHSFRHSKVDIVDKAVNNRTKKAGDKK
ncbi:MAG: type III pantothenate kinase [Elusimicrobia bacterium]|nr:type III pantothenate kinase [Elusimicrobiota bacterium]